MAGKLVRGFCTAAAATVAVGSLVAGGPASAQPGRLPLAPGPAAGSEGAGTAERRPQAANGRPDAAGPSVAGLLTDLRRLYRQSEDAAAAYRASERKLDLQRHTVDGLTGRLTRARRALHSSQDAAGRLARMQYQGTTEISPYLRLLLARDPQHALEQGHMLQRVSAARSAVVRRLGDDEQRARDLAAGARRALRTQEGLAERRQRQRDAVRARLRTVERLLAAAGSGHRHSRDREFPQTRTRDLPGARGPQGAPSPPAPWGAPQSLLAKALSSAHPPSRSGSQALRYAMQQIGKPYRWGAVGPDAFDCSGLTSQAWAHAGHPIPRTSQQQWAQLPRVSMDQLRPGDLVVYFPGATHVALYAGGGKVIQAPRPGERVKVSPVQSNPILGAVRPDPDAAPLDTANG